MTLFPSPLLASEQDESIKTGNASTTSGIYQIFSGGPTAANSVLTTENMKNASDRASIYLAV